MITAIKQRGVARIGSGIKLHPAVQHVDGGIAITCRCPNTQNGWGEKRAAFFTGINSTCLASVKQEQNT